MSGLQNEFQDSLDNKRLKRQTESNIMLREGKMDFPVSGLLPPQSGQRFRIRNFLLVARDTKIGSVL